MDCKWEDGFAITVRTEAGSAVISANREGLISLSRILTALSEERPGSHIHLDSGNGLEEDSGELIIERTE